MATLYIIPAYGDTGKEFPYKKLVTRARKKGYAVIFLDLQIKQGRVLSELVSDGIETIGKDKNATILGFSMGALISYCIAMEIPFRKAVLCSISPYLHNDLSVLGKKFERHVGKKLAADMKKMRYKDVLARSTTILYGEEDHPLMSRRSKSIYKRITSKKKLIPIADVGHGLTPKYLKAIVNEL